MRVLRFDPFRMMSWWYICSIVGIIDGIPDYENSYLEVKSVSLLIIFWWRKNKWIFGIPQSKFGENLDW